MVYCALYLAVLKDNSDLPVWSCLLVIKVLIEVKKIITD